MNTPQFAIETRNLNHSFRTGVKVVDDVSLQVPIGSIFGFLGPNGAGKTTSIRLLTGLLQNDSDNIFINGQSLKKQMPEVFQEIGTLVETPSLYLHLSGYNNLKVLTSMRDLPDVAIDEVLELVDLLKVKNRKVKEYSLGMKQRMGIALALLSKPTLLILDEPVNGLDPNGMIEMRELLVRLNKERNITIFISSHLLNEIEKMCTHIAFIHRGQLRFQGTLHELHRIAGNNRQVLFKVQNAAVWQEKLADRFQSLQLVQDQYLQFEVETDEDVIILNQQLVNEAVPVIGIQSKAGLEEWFMQQMKK
jgi:lantibiotic transport system ATP-binding protein